MTNEEDNIKQVTNALLFYTDHYYKKIEQTQLSTGSIFTGAILDEFNYCKIYAQEVMKNK